MNCARFPVEVQGQKGEDSGHSAGARNSRFVSLPTGAACLLWQIGASVFAPGVAHRHHHRHLVPACSGGTPYYGSTVLEALDTRILLFLRDVCGRGGGRAVAGCLLHGSLGKA
eukprot:COSAG01_NODE_4186_length_5260_cov_5.388684_2_plen_113_part_00